MFTFGLLNNVSCQLHHHLFWDVFSWCAGLISHFIHFRQICFLFVLQTLCNFDTSVSHWSFHDNPHDKTSDWKLSVVGTGEKSALTDTVTINSHNLTESQHFNLFFFLAFYYINVKRNGVLTSFQEKKHILIHRSYLHFRFKFCFENNNCLTQHRITFTNNNLSLTDIKC